MSMCMDTCAGVFLLSRCVKGGQIFEYPTSRHRLQHPSRHCQQRQSLWRQPRTAAILLLPRVHCSMYVLIHPGGICRLGASTNPRQLDRCLTGHWCQLDDSSVEEQVMNGMSVGWFANIQTSKIYLPNFIYLTVTGTESTFTKSLFMVVWLHLVVVPMYCFQSDHVDWKWSYTRTLVSSKLQITVQVNYWKHY